MKRIFTVLMIASLFLSAEAQKNAGKGWKPLFGKNLSDAMYSSAVWSETDRVLSATADEAIWTNTEYENFELDLEFKTDVKTNSGVVVYCTDRKDWIPNSVEIQINDDHATADDSNDTGKCGAIYGHLKPKRAKVVKAPGEWNHYNIKCKGKNIVVVLNGEEVTNMDMSLWTSGKINPDGSEIPSWLPKPFAGIPTKGYIGLQGKHGESFIWFRNCKIRPLK